jgi:hypothetical protein
VLTFYIIHDLGLIVVFSIYGDVVIVSLGTCHCTWPMCQLTFGWSNVNTLTRSKNIPFPGCYTGIHSKYFAMYYFVTYLIITYFQNRLFVERKHILYKKNYRNICLYIFIVGS